MHGLMPRTPERGHEEISTEACGPACCDRGRHAGASARGARRWLGCQVLICLSDPRGPESEKECVPPIEKLWDALRHGNPFPTCDLVASLASLPAELVDAFEPGTLESYGKGSSASNTWASGGYCRKDLVGWGATSRANSYVRLLVRST